MFEEVHVSVCAYFFVIYYRFVLTDLCCTSLVKYLCPNHGLIPCPNTKDWNSGAFSF